MSVDLVTQREKVMERADRAVDNAWPERMGQEYIDEMKWALQDLERVIGEMKIKRISPLELSRTYSNLASVYADLAPALGKNMLLRARDTYWEAETLLAGLGERIAEAKLNFNFGNTLRQLDPNDIRQLQDAERRFLAARLVFEEQAPEYLATVDEALKSTRNLLKVAPLVNTMNQQRADMDVLEDQMAKGEDPIAIAAKMKKVRERDGGITGMFSSIQGIVNNLPESAKDDAKYSVLQQQMSELTPQVLGGQNQNDEQKIMQLLNDKLNQEKDSGRVTQERAKTLKNLMSDFSQQMGGMGDDVSSLMAGLTEMHAKVANHTASLQYLSHGIDQPPSGSRAADLVERCWVLRRFLLEEMNQSGKSDGESKKSLELNMRSVEVDKRIYEAGSDDEQAVFVDQEEVRPLGFDVRRFAARHYPLLARPIWSGARQSVETNAVLFAGSDKVGRQVGKICQDLGLKVMAKPKGGSFALARWKQLQKANLVVCDLSVDEGSQRAAVAYELGVARTLGKPVVILAQEDQTLPFDVDIEPALLAGNTQDSMVISEAVDQALVWTMPRPRESGVPSTIDHVLGTCLSSSSNVYIDQTIKQLKKLQSNPDPVMATAALQTFVEYLNDGLMLIHPVWKPIYPAIGEAQVFHVMPFGEGWSNSVAQCVEGVCARRNVKYIRGDRVKDANIIRSIWEEINKSSHIVVDLTEFNSNVALELGIAHTLGRPTLLVGQGDTVENLYPMIAKERISPYETSQISELGMAVNKFLV